MASLDDTGLRLQQYHDVFRLTPHNIFRHQHQSMLTTHNYRHTPSILLFKSTAHTTNIHVLNPGTRLILLILLFYTR